MKFRELEINEQLLRAIDDMGFVDMTEIQERAIPRLMEGGDLIGKSQTGTGKTMAFAIPAIEKIDPELRKPQVLVLLPTRELALQVSEEFRKVLKYSHSIKVVAVFGGASIENQIRELKSGAQIVVGTPGRVMDHMRRKTLKFNALTMAVLDEADEMLNMGFREDIELILDAVDHVHTLDCTMVAGVCRQHRMYFPTLDENLKMPFVGHLVDDLGGIPIPGKLSEFRGFMERIEATLSQGDAVHLFPEGSLEPYCPILRPFQKGAFTFAYDAEVPLVPMVLTYRSVNGVRSLLRKKPLLHLEILKPVYPDVNNKRSYEIRRLLEKCRLEMQKILENK